MQHTISNLLEEMLQNGSLVRTISLTVKSEENCKFTYQICWRISCCP